MTNRTRAALVLFTFLSVFPAATARGDEVIQNWWHDSQRGSDWGKPCEVKIDSRPGYFKRQVRCRNGVGALWRGNWTEVFWDGSCKVTLVATRDTFREEIRCGR